MILASLNGTCLRAHRVVLVQLQLAGRRTGVLLRHVKVAGIRGGDEADLDGVGLGHRSSLLNRRYAMARGKCACRAPRSSLACSRTALRIFLRFIRLPCRNCFSRRLNCEPRMGLLCSHDSIRSVRNRPFLRTVYREGCALQAKGEHREAAESFSAAVAAAPDFADALQNLGFSPFRPRQIRRSGQGMRQAHRIAAGRCGGAFQPRHGPAFGS